MLKLEATGLCRRIAKLLRRRHEPGESWNLVCYGLGSLARGSAGLWQLACITSLTRDHDQQEEGGEGGGGGGGPLARGGHKCIYDPIFDQVRGASQRARPGLWCLLCDGDAPHASRWTERCW